MTSAGVPLTAKEVHVQWRKSRQSSNNNPALRKTGQTLFAKMPMDLNINIRADFHYHNGDDIKHLLENIMSAIADFAAKVKTFQDQQDTAIAGLTQDVQTLNDKITALQNSAGTITPADQALLDEITTRGQAISDKLAALDALTPPPPPPAPAP